MVCPGVKAEARRPDAQFWKTYLYEVQGIDEKAKRDIDAKLEADYYPRVPPGVDLQVEMRIGRDYIQTLEFARQQAVDIIILGRHGHSTLETVLFGSVTEKAARKAACPVLVVPISARPERADG